MKLTYADVIARHPNLAQLSLDGHKDYKVVDAATGFKYDNPTVWAIVNALKTPSPAKLSW